MPPSDPDIAPPALQIVTQAALPAALADSPFGPFVLQPCAGRDAVLARLAAGGCDALVLDDGADAIDLLAEAERDVAILVVAASPDPAAVLAWLARGAQDVLRIDELCAASLPQRLRAAIERKRLARDHGRRGSYRFACTADAEAFASVGRRFLQLPISSVRTLAATELAGLALAT